MTKKSYAVILVIAQAVCIQMIAVHNPAWELWQILCHRTHSEPPSVPSYQHQS